MDKHNIAPNQPSLSLPEKYRNEEKDLNEEYKDCIDKFGKDRKEMLNEEANITLFTIPMRFIPEDITGSIMADIFECVKYD